MRVDYILPNLFVGMLTRDSLKKAFKKNITTAQIMTFLESHAHPELTKQSQADSNKNRIQAAQASNQGMSAERF